MLEGKTGDTAGFRPQRGKVRWGREKKRKMPVEEIKKTRGNNKGSERKMIERLERESSLLKTAASVGLAVRQQVNRGLFLSPCDITDALIPLLKAQIEQRCSAAIASSTSCIVLK